ncbi:MAG: phosphoglycerate mutase family protein [Pirellulaceae bacterium]
MTRSILLSVMLMVVHLVTPPLFADTVVFLVRHAEKEAGDSRDPELSDVGRERVEALTAMLSSTNLAALFATEYKRTQQTVEPLARQKELLVTTIEASDTMRLVNKIKNEFADQAVLVAGHSNTVPAIITELGCEEQVTIDESDYDQLFMLIIGDDGKTTLVALHYPPFQ